jgi:hypothetical protein
MDLEKQVPLFGDGRNADHELVRTSVGKTLERQ